MKQSLFIIALNIVITINVKELFCYKVTLLNISYHYEIIFDTVYIIYKSEA